MKFFSALLTALIFAICTVGLALAGKGTVQVRAVPGPPNLSVEAIFSEPSGNMVLDGEESGALTITVKNSGAGDAFNVMASVALEKAAPGLSFDQKIDFGTVPSKGQVAKTVRLVGGEDLTTGEAKLLITFEEGNGFQPESVHAVFRTQAFAPPNLVVADMGVSSADGSAKISPGIVAEIIARIQNIGMGDARGVVAEVKYGPNIFPSGDGTTRFDLGALPSGKYKDVTFSFYTNKKIRNGEKVPVTIRLSEARPRFAAERPLNLVMNVQAKGATELVFQAVEAPKQDRKIELAGGLSVDVDMKIPEGKSAGKFDVAVIIGNRNYSAPGVPEVTYADRDAAVMREYLISTFGFDPKNIIYEKDAGVAKFQEIFGTAGDPRGKLYRFVKPGVSRVFVYYVGHGAPDLESQEAYFVPSDANPNYLGMTGYRLKTLYENLSKLPAKGVTIVLDACFSGNSDKGSLFKDISPAMVKVKKEYRAGPLFSDSRIR